MKYAYLTVLSLLLSLGTFLKTQAQDMLGMTGGLNIPTTEMNPAGTFRGGVNFIGKGLITPELKPNRDAWKFQYNTFIYYVDFTVFDWIEASFRETLLQNVRKGKKALREQDRSISIKVRPLKEGKYWPAIAFGVNDPTSITGHHPYSSAWAVMSKSVHSSALMCTFNANLGYMKSWDNSVMYDGVVAGITYQPDWFPSARVTAEYDTQGWNVGAQALLWKHLGLYVFTREFSAFGAGIRYQTTIKYRK